MDDTSLIAPAVSHSLPHDVNTQPLQPKEPVDEDDNLLSPPPDSCWVLTDSKGLIVMASDSWHTLWKFPQNETLGRNVNILQGAGTNTVAAKGLMARLNADWLSATARCTNPTKCGELHSHDLLILRVRMTQCGSDQSVFLAISSNIARTQRLSDEQQEKDAQVIPADPPDPLVKQALADFEAKNHEQELAQLARLSGVVHNKRGPFEDDDAIEPCDARHTTKTRFWKCGAMIVARSRYRPRKAPLCM
jgi:hypothetical protein